MPQAYSTSSFVAHKVFLSITPGILSLLCGGVLAGGILFLLFSYFTEAAMTVLGIWVGWRTSLPTFYGCSLYRFFLS